MMLKMLSKAILVF